MLRLIVIAVPRSIATTRPDTMQTGPCAEDAEVSPSRFLFSLSVLRALGELCGLKNYFAIYGSPPSILFSRRSESTKPIARRAGG